MRRSTHHAIDGLSVPTMSPASHPQIVSHVCTGKSRPGVVAAISCDSSQRAMLADVSGKAPHAIAPGRMSKCPIRTWDFGAHMGGREARSDPSSCLVSAPCPCTVPDDDRRWRTRKSRANKESSAIPKIAGCLPRNFPGVDLGPDTTLESPHVPSDPRVISGSAHDFVGRMRFSFPYVILDPSMTVACTHDFSYLRATFGRAYDFRAPTSDDVRRSRGMHGPCAQSRSVDAHQTLPSPCAPRNSMCGTHDGIPGGCRSNGC
jgi:hypothetical protein